MTNEERRRLTDHYPLDPDEQVGHLTPGGDPATAFATGTRYRDIYGGSLIHRPHDLWVAPGCSGRQLQDAIRERLLAARFSPDDADEWGFRNWPRFFAAPFRRDADGEWLAANAVVEKAVEFRDTGIPNDEAFLWTAQSVDAHDAAHNRNHGWNPDTYAALFTFWRQQGGPSSPEAWVEAPIPAWRALRYLRAGLTLTEALTQEQRHRAGEDVDAAVDLLIGLGHGGDYDCQPVTPGEKSRSSLVSGGSADGRLRFL